jgi:hypothetical protein
VSVTTLTQTLPFVAWVTLFSVAAGSFVYAALTGGFTEATPGYLRFTMALSAVFALITLASDTSLPSATVTAIHSAPADLELVRRAALLAFAICAFAYAVAVRNERNRSAVAALGGASVGVAALAAAFGWAPTTTDAVPLVVQLASLSIVTGGSTAAVVLGHWYLVTPRISVVPLVLQTRLMIGALVMQALLFVVWTTLGGGVGQDAWDAFTGPSVLLTVLRGVITVCFPIVVGYMAYRTAQTRSMESATGLLYINLAAVLAGTIGAAALYVSSGLLL